MKARHLRMAALLLGLAGASHAAMAMSNQEAKNLAIAAFWKHDTQALEQLKTAARGNDPAAQDWLGQYFNSSKNFAGAVQWYRKAADQGDADAQNNLGNMYDFGHGVPQDYAQALQWYRKAADQGNAYGLFNLGAMYDSGQGVPQDYAQALQWYRKAADQGDADAQFNLGTMYEHGHGVPQDYAQAVQWYRKVADQGYADGQFNLGVMYEHGHGVPQDYAQAVQWYRKAADQGDADAQNNLGVMYRFGQSVRQNFVIAYALYNLAAAGGERDASSNRDQLVSHMSESQVEAGQALTQRMQHGHVLSALDAYARTAARAPRSEQRPVAWHSSARTNGLWPARPAKRPGVTTCSTRCVNGSCWRTYDDGRHVHLNVAPTFDPLTNQFTFQPPAC